MVVSDSRHERERKAAALSYDPARDDLPRVVAAGQGELAEAIVALAMEHGVKVREDAALAEILAAVDVDSPIPLEVFQTVAEILAYLYGLEHPRALSGTEP